MPSDIEVKKNFMNTIYLKFECKMHKDKVCKYPGLNNYENSFFKTSTKEVNKWLKVGAAVFSTGNSILKHKVGEAMGNLYNVFSAAMVDD